MEFKFASINEALQHLSDITGKRIKIATESSIDFYVEKIGYNRSDNSVRYRIDMTISIPSDRTSLIFQSDFDDAENNLVPIAKQKLEDIQKVLAKIDESNIQHIDDIKVGDSDITFDTKDKEFEISVMVILDYAGKDDNFSTTKIKEMLKSQVK